MRRTLTLVRGVWRKQELDPNPIRRAVAGRFVTITEQGGTLTQAAMPATSDGVLM
ncbi:MAG: hypothetical protein H0X20_08265 [Chloroflexi bacterium]|nr:hypothetical protein [Chloroflexota bacterium]MBA3797206.1 hypothetical protein [Chloroflexota bacterium]